MNKEKTNLELVNDYVKKVVSGKKIAGKEIILACIRYQKDRKNKAYDFRTHDAEFVIKIIEKTFVHIQGESLDGKSLKGKPIMLEPWQKFIIYNLLGFYKHGTAERRYKEAFIYIPRKNGKTTFIAALTWALALLERQSGSTIYIVGAALRQAKQAFKIINENIKAMGESENFRILDNNAQHSIERKFVNAEGEEKGSIYIEALAANPDAQDSLNCNIAICDEIHAYKSPKQYNVIKEAMKAYTNKLIIGITTAGDRMTSFCFQRVKYGEKVLNGTIKDESIFVFLAKADEDEKGNVDFTNPVQHEKANPNYGVTIRPEDILNDALQAQNDPQQRKDFFAKSLNIYTAARKEYFDIAEFRASDQKYSWSIDDLAKLPIKWYGGADLSKLYDLTAAAMVGKYKGVDILITHAWFPVEQAHRKAEEDGIPLFGWRDDGWLTMCNTPTVNHAEIVNWFIAMRKKGFKIADVGHDRKFCREYFLGMKKAGFRITDQPQYFYKKSEGFRYIENSTKNGTLYYLHSEAYEYCVQNVAAVEKTDDMIQFEKIGKNQRIDIFDASVFAVIRMLENMERSSKASKWFEG